MKQNPIVSVCMITYGHEKFIEEAINGVLMQETNFEVELIIANDCSPDNTDAVVEKILKNHPKADRIKYTKHEKNKGVNENFLWALKQCNGKFIALCEGDDYWTSENKLQKQVNFLEKNPTYFSCFHRVKILKGDTLIDDYIEKRYNKIAKDKLGKKELLEVGNFIHTTSVVFRNNKDHNYPIAFKYSPVLDYLLHIYNSQFGYIKRIDEVYAVYRHGVGIFSSLNESKMRLNMINYLSCLVSFLKDDNDKKIILERINILIESQIKSENKLIKIKKPNIKIFFKQLINIIKK